MVGECVAEGRVDFAEVGCGEGFDSAGFCFDTLLLIASFAFSLEWLCDGAGPVTGWEEGATPVEGPSGDCFGGVTASLSAST